MTAATVSSSTGLIPLPQTVYLGAHHQLCATVHRPAGDATRSVVMVEPFGIEALAAEATYRRLTELLLAVGIAVVRFTPPGVGDSGELRGVPFVNAWTESVSDAIMLARSLSCERRVDVVGLRLGATIAAYATALTPVDRVVFWAPVAGKAFAREFKLLGAAGASPGTKAATEPAAGAAAFDAPGLMPSLPGDIEAGGFVLSAEFAAQLSNLDLRAIERVDARSALVVDRDDIRSADKIMVNFAALGLVTDVITPTGYTDMRLDDPEEGLVPEEALQSILTWLGSPDTLDPQESAAPTAIGAATTLASVKSDPGKSDPGKSDPGKSDPGKSDPGKSDPAEPVDELHLEVRGVAVVERPTVVKVDGVALAAVITRPLDTLESGAVERLPAIVMLTTGSNPRCGAGRLQTILARDLASRGHLVLRYDRRGIGLSFDEVRRVDPQESTGDNRKIASKWEAPVDAYDARHCRDLQAVIDYVRNDADQASIALVGMCSGAYTAFHYGKALTLNPNGGPVKAIVAINQIIFLDRSWTTKAESPAMAVKAGYELRTAWRDPSSWKRLLSGGIPIKTTARRLSRLVGMQVNEAASRLLVAAHLHRPAALVEALLHIRNAGVRQIYIFDDAETGLGQLRLDGRAACRTLEKTGWMAIHTVAGAGHTFGPTESKRWLARQLADDVSVAVTGQQRISDSGH